MIIHRACGFGTKTRNAIDFSMISPWWTRAWTVQDCLLPKKNLMLFETWSVTWDHMFTAEYMKNSHVEIPAHCCKEASHVSSPHQRALIEEWMWHPSLGHRYMSVVRGSSSPPCFHQAIMDFTSRTCTNPGDKIYSMLGLATHPIYQNFRVN